MNREVCVISGGGSGIGLAAARYMSKEKVIVLSGRTARKLENDAQELSALGFEVQTHTCDISDRSSVERLAEFSASLGEIRNVINSAGMSPSMSDAEKIIRVNALGTVYMNSTFVKYMKPGSVIIDVASNSAYSLPALLIPERVYPLALEDEDRFVRKLVSRSGIAGRGYEKAGLAYAFSKNFVIWYAKYCAFQYGRQSIRVASLSPGLIDTGMGRMEASHGGRLIEMSAEERMGRPEELGFALAMLADERNGYLSGVDVLVDGGSVSGMKWRKKKKKRTNINGFDSGS